MAKAHEKRRSTAVNPRGGARDRGNLRGPKETCERLTDAPAASQGEDQNMEKRKVSVEERKTREAKELCEEHGITDLTDCGWASFDGCPEELIDHHDEQYKNSHKWFTYVWPYGRHALEAASAAGAPSNHRYPEPLNC